MRDVRRWRKEAYEDRQRMTPQERDRLDQETESLATRMGLRVMKPEELQTPDMRPKKVG